MIGFARPYRGRLAGVFVLALVAAALDIAPIHLVRRVFDGAVPARSVSMLAVLAALFGAVLVLREACGVGLRALFYGTTERILRDMRWALFDKLLSQSLPFHRRHDVGETVSRVLGDVEALQHSFSIAILSPLASGFVVLGTTAYLFTVHPWLGCAVIVPLAIHAFVQRPFHARIRTSEKAVRDQNDALSGELVETLTNIEDVQAQCAEARQRSRMRSLLQRVRDRNLRLLGFHSFAQAAGGLVSGVASLVVLAAGGWLAIEGRVSLGGLVAFVAALGQLLRGVEELTYFRTQLGGMQALASRVRALLDSDVTVRDRPGAGTLPAGPLGIDLESVTFGYDPDRPVLDGFTLHVRPGEKVGLVGRSGCGKSTVLRLIQRFYDPDGGTVRVGGRDVRDVRLLSLRERIANVPQRPALFRGTVSENVTLGAADRGDRVDTALQAVHLDSDLAQEGGREYEVGPMGARLSEGQRQRIAVARALFRDTPVLLLDEATSALDPVNQQAVHRAIQDVLSDERSCTCLVIAHRLATLRHVDRVAVLEDGRIVEEGSFDALLARKGRFAALFEARDGDAAGPATT